MRQKRARKTKTNTRSQEAIKNVTTNAIGVAQATNPLITVATYVALFLAVLPIGILGAVQFLPAQPSAAKTVLEAPAAEEDATVELTAAERRAQRREAREVREAKTETVAVEPEPEITVEVVDPGFNGFNTQNADFDTMQTPFAGGFGMMPMPPFGGFPGFGAMPTTDADGFPAFGTMPTTDANGFPGFGTMPTTDADGFGATPNADENTFNGFGADFGNF